MTTRIPLDWPFPPLDRPKDELPDLVIDEEGLKKLEGVVAAVEEAFAGLAAGASWFHEGTLERIVSIVNSTPQLAAEIRRLWRIIELRRQLVDLTSIQSVVYAGAVKECEHREATGALRGNGHHMAQAIAANVVELLKTRGW